MYGSVNISIKKTTAFALSFLFLFVTGVKVFHAHGTQKSPHTEGISLVSGTVCSICDYHFAKDSDAEVAVIVLRLPVSYPTPVFATATSIATTTVSSAYLRGPPVSLS